MLQTFVITLREGLEAFLIVAITLAYLKKTGRGYLSPAVHCGIACAVVLSIIAGILLSETGEQPLWEGVIALVTAVLVASFTVHMWRTAKLFSAEIGQRIEAAAERTGKAAFAGVFAFTVLMISREGVETALLINALIRDEGLNSFVAGAVLGVCAAAAMAWAWSRFGHKVNLTRFFQVTAIFLLLFTVQLLVYGFHELTEADVLPINNGYWHLITEPYGPEGSFGQSLTYALVAVPAVWLFLTWARDSLTRH